MPPRRCAAHDSLAANPRAKIALEQLFLTDSVKNGDKASKRYNDEGLQKIVAPVDPEKFRERFKKLHDSNFRDSIDSKPTVGEHLFDFFSNFF